MRDDKSNQEQARTRRKPVSSLTASSVGIASLHIVVGPADTVAIGHCSAACAWQQRAFAGVLDVSFQMPRLDVQRYSFTKPGGANRAWAGVQNAARPTSQSHELVCRDMATLASSCRYGMWPAKPTAWCLFAMEIHLMRTHLNVRFPYPWLPYKYGFRTLGSVSKYGNRGYAGHFPGFLSTVSVHYLEIPSIASSKGKGMNVNRPPAPLFLFTKKGGNCD